MSWLTRRWQDPVQPLHVALLFQAVIFVLIFAVDVPYAAAGFIGGTVGCVIASLRMQQRSVQRGDGMPT